MVVHISICTKKKGPKLSMKLFRGLCQYGENSEKKNASS